MGDCLSFSTVVNLLLTAAIAYAGVMQWRVSKALLKLQQVVESQRTKAWTFLRLKQSVAQGHNTAVLQISNLSQVGVWIEKVTVHLETPSGAPNKAEVIQLETVLAPMASQYIDIRLEVQRLVEPKGTEVRAIVLLEAFFWANGEWQNEKTGRYSMNVGNAHVSKVTPL